MGPIPMIDGVGASPFRHANVWMGVNVFILIRIKGEPMDSFPGRKDQDGTGTIHDIPGSQLLRTLPEKRLVETLIVPGILKWLDRKNGTDNAIDVSVGRTVQGIEQHRIFPAGGISRNP